MLEPVCWLIGGRVCSGGGGQGRGARRRRRRPSPCPALPPLFNSWRPRRRATATSSTWTPSPTGEQGEGSEGGEAGQAGAGRCHERFPWRRADPRWGARLALSIPGALISFPLSIPLLLRRPTFSAATWRRCRPATCLWSRARRSARRPCRHGATARCCPCVACAPAPLHCCCCCVAGRRRCSLPAAAGSPPPHQPSPSLPAGHHPAGRHAALDHRAGPVAGLHRRGVARVGRRGDGRRRGASTLVLPVGAAAAAADAAARSCRAACSSSVQLPLTRSCFPTPLPALRRSSRPARLSWSAQWAA